MGRFWSIMFLLVPILGVGSIVCAMMTDSWPLYDHWLPVNINEHGAIIDNLFLFILVLTGAIFIATGIVLFWFLWKYDAARSKEPVSYTHGSHTLEIVWSILPAATLLFIAIFQMDAWAGAKMARPMLPGADGILGTPDDLPQPPLALVSGRQFEWRIQYPGPDGVINTPDDLYTVNELHIPLGEDVVLQIESQDVLHSFFLPNLRVKQDVVPGMRQYTWFKANRKGKYDIVCAELCGWGHYKMRGRLVVEDRASFDQWLKTATQEQATSEFTPSEEE